MKTMKIYGMRDLLEWHGTVHSKGIKMKVDFTNGSATAYGVAPATFITSDTLTQAILENSDEFKSGRIRLERSVPLPGEKDERVVDVSYVDGVPLPGEKDKRVVDVSYVDGVPLPGEKNERVVDVSNADENTSPLPTAANSELQPEPAVENEVEDEGAHDLGASESEPKNTIKVADKADAIDWLKEHFPDKDYTANKLRAKEAFESACKECGVEFEW